MARILLFIKARSLRSLTLLRSISRGGEDFFAAAMAASFPTPWGWTAESCFWANVSMMFAAGW